MPRAKKRSSCHRQNRKMAKVKKPNMNGLHYHCEPAVPAPENITVLDPIYIKGEGLFPNMDDVGKQYTAWRMSIKPCKEKNSKS